MINCINIDGNCCHAYFLFTSFHPQTGTATLSSGIPADLMGLDVGEESSNLFSPIIENANTIIWNGPLGVSEFEKFANGSRRVLESVIMATEKGATTIIGNMKEIQ